MEVVGVASISSRAAPKEIGVQGRRAIGAAGEPCQPVLEIATRLADGRDAGQIAERECGAREPRVGERCTTRH